MDDTTYKELLDETLRTLGGEAFRIVAIIGDARTADRLAEDLQRVFASSRLVFVAACTSEGVLADGSWDRLRTTPPDLLVIAEDSGKEAVLRSVVDVVVGFPEVILAGYGHFDFKHRVYDHAVERLREPSLANGYPNSRIHLFQCLENAIRRGLSGSIVEFGMFRGGTTQFLREACRELGVNYPIIGFDTFDGFPPKRHLFDMYNHPDLAKVELCEVSERLRPYDIQIIPGDITVTSNQTLRHTQVLLAFIDTDNYTSAQAAILSVVDRVIPGGAIVFDHYFGTDRFKRTLGERMAAQELLQKDARYFNLHGTGVFLRHD